MHCKANAKWRQRKQWNGSKGYAIWTWMDTSVWVQRGREKCYRFENSFRVWRKILGRLLPVWRLSAKCDPPSSSPSWRHLMAFSIWLSAVHIQPLLLKYLIFFTAPCTIDKWHYSHCTGGEEDNQGSTRPYSFLGSCGPLHWLLLGVGYYHAKCRHYL